MITMIIMVKIMVVRMREWVWWWAGATTTFPGNYFDDYFWLLFDQVTTTTYPHSHQDDDDDDRNRSLSWCNHSGRPWLCLLDTCYVNFLFDTWWSRWALWKVVPMEQRVWSARVYSPPRRSPLPRGTSQTTIGWFKGLKDRKNLKEVMKWKGAELHQNHLYMSSIHCPGLDALHIFHQRYFQPFFPARTEKLEK